MAELKKLRRFFHDEETHFVDLTQHFFNRLFDTELISKEAEAHLGVVQILALVAVPGIFYLVFAVFSYDYVNLFFTPAFYTATSSSDQCRYVLFSMAVTGMVAVLEWERLFPDGRDYAILTPLPLKLRTIFAAKIAALLLFLGLFILAVAGPPAILYPLVASTGLRQYVTFQYLLRMMTVHAVAVFSGCLFMFLFFVVLQGIVINLLKVTLFRKISAYVQGLAITVLLWWFFLLPLIPRLLPRWEKSTSRLFLAFPPLWFLGLYQTLLGSRDPLFLSLARIAVAALVLSAVIAAAAYFACYRRYSQMALETPAGSRPWRFGIAALVSRLLDRRVLSEGLERATFYFVLQTLARSAKHRLYFATYVAVGLGLALLGILELTMYSTRVNFWAAASRPDEALLSAPLVVSFLVLSGMQAVFARPSELPANWIFQITDQGNGRRLLAGVRKAMVAVAIVPLFALTFTIYAFLWGFLASLLTVLFGVLLSLILMEVLLYSYRKVPFTCSYLPGKANLPVMSAIYGLAFAFYAYSMASLERWMFHEPIAWIAAVGAEVLILNRIIALRNRSFARGFSFQYEDDPLPAVQSLNLSA